MSGRSLRQRLWIAAALSITLALSMAAVGLITLFERHVERRIGEELHAQLNQLAAAIAVGPEGAIALEREPTDPRFATPLSGLYWQIDAADQAGLLRSRSLWDHQLEVREDALPLGSVHAHIIEGPDRQTLMVRERQVRLDANGRPIRLRLIVAIDRAELTAARDAFAADLLPYLALIALVLVVATLIQVQTGLAPLDAVQRGVGAIRSGATRRLAETYPHEVMPLVGEVNALLGEREQALERARAWTADLAHGLKTPLGALVADAQRLRDQGNPGLADDLEQLACAMRRRVDRELVRARVRSGTPVSPARVDVIATLQRVLRTLERTPDGARIAWHLSASGPIEVALLADDLLELLGNLLENAAKWAESEVEIRIASGECVEIQIDDDGPGVPLEQMARLGERGLRLDERREGSGLGLAIVRDVTDAYGGLIQFAAAARGGLSVKVQLPRASRS
jgi:signal transduction histidine kinase